MTLYPQVRSGRFRLVLNNFLHGDEPVVVNAQSGWYRGFSLMPLSSRNPRIGESPSHSQSRWARHRRAPLLQSCCGVKSRRCPTISVANSISERSSGPHRNSDQATVLITSVSPSSIQRRSLRSSGDPGFRDWIRKLVSKWIIETWKIAAEQPLGAQH